jgi:hypothetical protein
LINKGNEIFSDNLLFIIPGKKGKCRVCIEDTTIPDNQYTGWGMFGEFAIVHQYGAPGQVNSSAVLIVWHIAFWNIWPIILSILSRPFEFLVILRYIPLKNHGRPEGFLKKVLF